MSASHAVLCAKLKQLGFAERSEMRLYGEEFEFLSDPIVIADGAVFVDAREKRSSQTRRIPIPLPIVNMANAKTMARPEKTAA
jgi:hypothetical protein